MSDPLQTALGYDFKRTALLRQALTHASFTHEHNLSAFESNERLEFLGDAVLELCISDFLYHKFSNLPEGDLTRLRASFVCETTLAKIARKLKVGDYLLLGIGEAKEKGREKDSILSDALESIFGAIYLDGGIDAVRNIIVRLFTPFTNKSTEQKKDFKTTLQEILQKKSRETAVYRVVEEQGPSHKREYISEVLHKGKVLARGEGRSKKESEQKAAEAALKKLGN